MRECAGECSHDKRKYAGGDVLGRGRKGKVCFCSQKSASARRAVCAAIWGLGEDDEISRVWKEILLCR